MEEEKRIRAETRRDLAADERRGQEWTQADSSEQKGQFSKLLHLVEQSKVSYLRTGVENIRLTWQGICVNHAAKDAAGRSKTGEKE